MANAICKWGASTQKYCVPSWLQGVGLLKMYKRLSDSEMEIGNRTALQMQLVAAWNLSWETHTSMAQILVRNMSVPLKFNKGNFFSAAMKWKCQLT